MHSMHSAVCDDTKISHWDSNKALVLGTSWSSRATRCKRSQRWSSKGINDSNFMVLCYFYWVLDVGTAEHELLCFRVKKENQGQEVHLVIKGRQWVGYFVLLLIDVGSEGTFLTGLVFTKGPQGPPGLRGGVGREGLEGLPGLDGVYGKDGTKGIKVSVLRAVFRQYSTTE